MASKTKFRYWTRCFQGQLIYLSRSPRGTCDLERLTKDGWVLDERHYHSVAYEASYDEIRFTFAKKVRDAILYGEPLACTLPCCPSRHEKFQEQSPTELVSMTKSMTAIETFTTDTEMFTGFSQLQTAAIAMHEMYLAFISAGFTEEQAIKLVTGLISDAQNQSQ